MTNKSVTMDFSFVLASSVHDMKNSLGMLLNTLNKVMEKYPPQDDAQATDYAILEYEAARINGELIQLLSLYRLEHDQIRVHIDEYFVGDLLKDQIARNDALIETRAIAVELVCDDALQGYFDSDLISGVVNNVLVNCVRYCKQRIRVSAKKTPEGLCISIEDDGVGYPPDMLDSATQVDSRTSFAKGRPHMGILFAHKVALMHENKGQQGFIRLSNGGDLQGGCFSIYLP